MGLFDGFTEGSRRFGDREKYLKDYQIIEKTDAKGRTTQRAVSIGAWTVPEKRGGLWYLLLGGALGLSLLAALGLMWVLLLSHAYAGELAVMLPLLASLFPAMYLLMGAFSLPFRGRPMRRDQYMHSFIRASRSAAAVAVFTLAALLISLFLRAVRGDWFFLPGDARFAAGCAVTAVLSASVIPVLRRVPLTERENGTYQASA